MKTLKDILNEGILSDIDDAIINMDNAIKEFDKFGNNFKIIDFKADCTASYNKLNARILKAKTEALQSAKRIEELYQEAMDAMKSYRGQDDDNEED